MKTMTSAVLVSVLLVMGVLAALAMLAPQLVVLGFLLIIPGLILLAAPTVFVYLAATLLIRAALPRRLDGTRTAIAFSLAMLIGWAVMQPFRSSAIANYAAVVQPDIEPSQPIALNGHVRVEIDSPRFPAKESESCNALCMTLLGMPSVTSVTSVSENEEVGFALVPSDHHPQPGIFPSKLGRFAYLCDRTERFKNRRLAEQEMEASWALRLATNERLVHREPVSTECVDWVVRLVDKVSGKGLHVRRIEIVDSEGTVHFRKSQVVQYVPRQVFYMGFDFDLSLRSNRTSFHVGRQRMQSGQLTNELERPLLASLQLPNEPFGAECLAKLRSEVAGMLADPSASAARVELASRWLFIVQHDTSTEDQSLIAAIVADPRVDNIIEPLKNVFREVEMPSEFQLAHAKRILMPHTTDKERYLLAQQLASMPEGTFANPAAEHWAIWSNPELRHQAAPFVARIADLGPQKGVPMLLELLDETLELKHWHEQRTMIEGIQAGFARLGQKAAPAIPVIQHLFAQQPSPLISNSLDGWRFALARMGVALEDLPFADYYSDDTVASKKESLRRQMQCYEQASK